MKHIDEHINDSINEAREAQFRVAFHGVTDKEGLPITVTILVPNEYKDKFADYLADELYNTVYQAEDYRGWPIGK